MLVVLASALVTFLYRLYLIREFYPTHPDRDEISHFTYVKEIQAQKGRIPSKIDAFLLNYNDYPNGFHKFIALLGIPQQRLEDYGRYIPVLFDVLLLFLIAGFIHLQGGHSYLWLLCFPFIRLFWSKKTSIFFGERAFGVLWGNIYLVSVFAFVQTGHWGLLATAVLSFSVAAASSIFTNQATFFFSILMAIFLQDWRYLAVYILSLVASFVLTKGYSWTVIKGQVSYSILYQTFLSKIYLKNNFYKNAIKVFNKFRFSKFKKEFFENPVYMSVSNCPIYVAFLILWLSHGATIEPLTAYALCGLLLCIVIATEPLKFLGQAERYIEFSVLPILAYLSFFSVRSHPILFGGVVFLSLWSVAYHIGLNKKGKKAPDLQEHSEYFELNDFLAQLPKSVILPIPTKIINFSVYKGSQHRYVSTFVSPDSHESFKELMPDCYTYPGSNLDFYIQKYQVSYIVLHKNAPEYMEKQMKQPYYNFENYKLIYESKTLAVLEV